MTSLASLKEYIGISIADTSEDAFLDKLIDRATARIESHTARLLKKRSLDETYDGTGTEFLLLRQFPVTLLTEVNIDVQRTFAASTIVDPNALVLSPEEGKIGIAAAGATVAFSATFPLGTRIVRVKYDAGFDPIPPDLEEAAIKLAATDFARAREGADGVISESAEGRTITWKDGMPEEIAQMLLQYERRV